jgi:hypothetical protein
MRTGVSIGTDWSARERANEHDRPRLDRFGDIQEERALVLKELEAACPHR